MFYHLKETFINKIKIRFQLILKLVKCTPFTENNVFIYFFFEGGELIQI